MSHIMELIKAAEKATPGPWEASDYGYGTTPPTIGSDVYSESGKIVSCSNPYGYRTEEAAQNQNNAKFIECSRNSIADLQRLAEWVRLTEHGKLCASSDGPCICGLDSIRKLLED